LGEVDKDQESRREEGVAISGNEPVTKNSFQSREYDVS